MPIGASSNRIFTPPQGPGSLGSWTWPITKTPLFGTLKQTPVNLRNEVRLSETPYPIWLFDYDFGYLKGAEYIPNSSNNSGLAYVLGFYGASLSSADSWLFQDPYDNTVTDEPFGYGDGATTQFQLVRSINGVFPDIIQNPNVITNIKQAGTPLTPISGSGYYIGLENLLQQSEGFATSPWVAGSTGGASVPTLTGGQTGPDGASTAFQIALPTTSGSQSSYLVQTVPSFAYWGQTFTFSVWLKASSPSTPFQISLGETSPASVTPAVQSLSLTTSWVRYTVTGTYPVIGIPGYAPSVWMAQTAGHSSSTVYAYGAQLERNATASGYIKTTTSYSIPNGVVTFRIAPPAGAQLTWTGSFWFRCRFDEEQLQDLRQQLYQIWELQSLKFRSVILGDV